MALLEKHYYHKTISLITGVFGSIFNDIKIVRDDGKTIKVPISYSSTQKYNVRASQNLDPTKINFSRRLPRIGYQLISWSRDPARVKNKHHKIIGQLDQTNTTKKVQYNRIPYKFQFKLNVATKYMDDLLQISEQILSAFNPSITVVIKDNSDFDEISSIEVTLETSDKNDVYEGSFEDSKILETEFSFVIDGYIYQPTNDTPVIKTVYVNYKDSVGDTFTTDIFDEDDL